MLFLAQGIEQNKDQMTWTLAHTVNNKINIAYHSLTHSILINNPKRWYPFNNLGNWDSKAAKWLVQGHIVNKGGSYFKGRSGNPSANALSNLPLRLLMFNIHCPAKQLES